ncbi:MAG: hypothetical protein KatS3mg105_2592 [Gemmatales bacterium]|nr:MAG: hypothetical protein KatS3mg105_2592 [Gemmatales bacterium]
MFYPNALVALWLLTAPGDAFSPLQNDVMGCCSKDLLCDLAVLLEILDPRETRYVLKDDADFDSDLVMLRRRFHELKDAPELAEAYRFPDRETITGFLEFNRAYRRTLAMRYALEMASRQQIAQAIDQTDFYHRCWDAARDARCEYYYVTVRRHALRKLRELLGHEAYYSGELPPYVPLWSFQAVR